MTLVDTDVLIWYLRGNKKAARELDHLNDFSMSTVSYIELVQGMRSKKELDTLRSTITEWGSDIVPINEMISTKAILYVEEHFHSHNLRLADALIAATASLKGMALLTGNIKHYKVIKGLTLQQFIVSKS